MAIRRLQLLTESLICSELIYILITASMFQHSFSTTGEGVALLKLMDRWHANFTTWIPGGDPCLNWENVNCSAGHVTELHLENQGLSGELAPEIGQLKELILLDLSDNNIQGNVPMNLASCDKLRSLQLAANPWNVSFPEVIPQLLNLEELRFGSAGLFGRVPKEFYRLTQLKILYLNNNTELKADLKDFSALTNLEELSLWQISFKSEIPEELGNLKKLQYFNCHDCALHGGLPESFGGLLALNRIHIRQNTLTGGIPDSWKNLKSMTYFRLDSNALLGEFPEWVFDVMPNLTELYLSRNQFYGTPPSIASLEKEYNVSKRLEKMRWDCNYLEGPTPCGSQNPCSNATLEQRGLNLDNSSFYFYPNCYSDASTDDISRVSNCVGHTLTCAQFDTIVLQQNGCPACPAGQELKSGSTANNGCICGLYSSSGSSFPVGAVVGGVSGLVFVFAVILAVVIWKRRRHFSFMDVFTHPEEPESGEWVIPAGVQRFTVEELARITSDFSDEHVIGHGGFGKVYFGALDDGRAVAIKRAAAGSVQGVREFRNEITLLSRLHHRHLVRLEGFCVEKDFQVLVYEFMKMGNLQDNLYGEKARAGMPLTAKKRLDIAYGVAQGLEYLHSFADPPVIHRDIKPSNILLDDLLVAKVADFGISKENSEDDTHVSTKPAGTAGFLDPEYFLSRQLTTASDVYAYGVVLLELITGQMAIDHRRLDEFNLIQWVRKRFKTAGVISIIDPAIENEYSPEAYTVVTELALKCADFSKSVRPSMKEVLTVLESIMVTAPTTPAGANNELDWLARRPGHRNQYMSMDSESMNHTHGSQASEPCGTFTVDSRDLTPR